MWTTFSIDLRILTGLHLFDLLEAFGGRGDVLDGLFVLNLFSIFGVCFFLLLFETGFLLDCRGDCAVALLLSGEIAAPLSAHFLLISVSLFPSPNTTKFRCGEGIQSEALNKLIKTRLAALLDSPCTAEVNLLPPPAADRVATSFTSLPRARLCAKFTHAEGLVRRAESCLLASHTCSWSRNGRCVSGEFARNMPAPAGGKPSSSSGAGPAGQALRIRSVVW